MKSKLKLAVAVYLSLNLTVTAQLLTVKKAYCQTAEQKTSVSTEQLGAICQQIASQISKSWQSTTNKSTEAEVLTFKITNDGYPYQIRLTAGFDKPESIKSALRAVLSAAPFKSSSKATAPFSDIATSQATCSFKGDSQKPEISLVLEETNLDKTELERDVLVKLPYKEKQSQTDSIIRVWLITQLVYLNQSQLNLPESSALAEKISSCMRQAGLNSNNPNDWKALAEFLDPQIPIARNPDKSVMSSCDGSINAYFQAWKLDHNADTLESLTKIYDKKLACDCLAASKGDAVMLAAAAVLTDQHAEAQELLETAIEAGRADAQLLAKQLAGTSDSDIKMINPKIAATRSSQKHDIDWKTIFSWLPPDTETVMVVRNPITDPKEKERITNLNRHADQLQQIGADLPDIDNTQAKELFSKSKITLSIGSAQAFKAPTGLGGGKYQGAKILVFAKENRLIANQIMTEYKKNKHRRIIIEGFEVLAFDNETTQHMSKLNNFVFAPKEGVLVSATDERYARKMLERIKSSSTVHAIESNLPLWKELNTNSNFWAIRHYNRSSMPFDQTTKIYSASLPRSTKEEDEGMRVDMKAIGLTVENRPDNMIVIRFFSDDQSALQDKVALWKRMITRPRNNQQVANAAASDKNSQSTFKSSIDQNMATIEFKISDRDDGSMLLVILAALGHLVYI